MKFKAIILGIALLVGSVFGTTQVALAENSPPPVYPCMISDAAIHVCQVQSTFGSYGVFYGVVNDSLTAQTVTITCYDNNQGLVSGTVALTISDLGATQIIDWPAGGRIFKYGLVCQASGIPSGTIELYLGNVGG